MSLCDLRTHFGFIHVLAKSLRLVPKLLMLKRTDSALNNPITSVNSGNKSHSVTAGLNRRMAFVILSAV